MLALEPEKDSYNPGDKVKVTADSNPSTITYKWVTTATNDTLGTEDTIDITDEMVGSQSLKVIVCNTIPIPKATSNCEERQLEVTVMSKCLLMLVVCWISKQIMDYLNNRDSDDHVNVGPVSFNWGRNKTIEDDMHPGSDHPHCQHRFRTSMFVTCVCILSRLGLVGCSFLLLPFRSFGNFVYPTLCKVS